MKQEAYDHLAWDTDTFGFNVARVTARGPGRQPLRDILRDLRSRNYRLVYIFADPGDGTTVREVLDNKGFLAARNITYVAELGRLENSAGKRNGMRSSGFNGSMPTREMERLAVQSGQYSRFHQDPLFPRELFELLYRRWIDRAVRKEIAREVLVLQKEARVIGMVTLGEKNGRGDIGLLAVDTMFQRSHIASGLVQDAQHWFREQGFTTGQVVTQAANRPACRLYEKCGYRIETIEDIYHCWL